MDEIHIVTASNDNYVTPLSVMLYSLFENKQSNVSINLYIIDGKIGEQNKYIITKVLNNFGSSPKFISLDDRLFNNVSTHGHVSKEAFYRIMIPEIIDCKITKALYLDCDLIVKSCISQLWKLDLYEYAIGAIEDPSGYTGIPWLKDKKCFNSGVMLLNLTKWRKDNLTEEIKRFIEGNSSNLLCWDQDALNAVLHSSWLSLDWSWNLQVSTMDSNLISPNIIHYNSHVKPWNGKPPLREEYLYYYKKLKAIRGIRRHLK